MGENFTRRDVSVACSRGVACVLMGTDVGDMGDRCISAWKRTEYVLCDTIRFKYARCEGRCLW